MGVPLVNVQSTPGNNANLETILVKSATWTTTPGPDYGGSGSYPQTSNYLVLDVEITATKGRPAVSDSWTATAADGTVYGKADYMSGYSPWLPMYKSIEVGQSASGLVVLDVPQGDVTVTMPDAFSNTVVIATWHVPA